MRDQGKPGPDELTDVVRRHRGHMILEAGAGTGKTFSLTERVIHQLVERRVPLERMLALTFTDFAAAEMRARIYAAINRRLKDESKQISIQRYGELEPDYKEEQRPVHKKELEPDHKEEQKPDHKEPDRKKEKKADTGEISLLKHLHTTRRRFSGNYISTFHSFCNRILHYFPDEITEISVYNMPRYSGDEGFGPHIKKRLEGSFELLSDYDEVLWMMEWKKNFYKKYKHHPGLQRQLSRLSVSDFESFMQQLSGVDEEALYELSTLTPQGYAGMLHRFAGVWQDEKNTLEKTLLEEFASHPEWFKSRDHIPHSFEDMTGVKIKDGLSKKIFDKSEIDSETLDDVNTRAVELFDYNDQLQKIREYLSDPEIEKKLTVYPEQDAFDPDHEAYWNMCDLAELALRWHTLMRYQRFDAGCFNYDDIIWLTHELFEQNPAVVQQMRERFDQILVDEFQDTDRRQWQIIRKLAFGGHDKEVLIVGDVKQAIYGFRGGDVAMMGRVHDELKERSLEPDTASSPDRMASSQELPLKVVPLDYSFRSNRTIISFVNRLFNHIFRKKSETTSYEAHNQPLSPPSSQLSENIEAGGEVRLLRTDYRELRKEAADWSIEAEALAGHMELLESRRIARFLRDIYDGKREEYKRITEKMRRKKKAVGVLYRRRKHIHALEQALDEVGLGYSVAKGTRYYERREVRDAWLLLSFLLDAYDDVSLVGLLRSPMISFSDSGLLAVRVAIDDPQRDYPNFWSAISDHQAWGDELLNNEDRFALEEGVPLLQKLREWVPTDRVSDLLERAFFTDGPYPGGHPGNTQVRENLVKLLDVIRELESTGRGTLFEITGYLSDRIREEAGDSEAEQPDPASIQLMTIHGSKGLQFPMVVIPDMYAGHHEGGVRLYVADDDNDSFAWPALAYKPGNREGDEDAQDSFVNHVLKSENLKRNQAETQRLFYVAVTRAETHLLLSMARPKSVRTKGSFANLLNRWLRQEEPEEAVIDDLGVEELEQLAKALKPDKPGETDKPVEDASSPSEYMTGSPIQNQEPVFLEREGGVFAEADREVSVETLTASGQKPGSVSPAEGQLPTPWSILTPAEAGTLIHRTLETGFDLLDDKDGSRSIDHFWQRELLKIDYSGTGSIVKENREELLRHCRNASQWLGKQFGESAFKRFEVSFDLTSRKIAGKTVTVRGSIDLIIRDQDGNDHIIDFKTGNYEKTAASGSVNSAEIAVLRQFAKQNGYDRQIAIYQQAYSEITNRTIPSSCVWLLFTAPGGGCAVSLADLTEASY